MALYGAAGGVVVLAATWFAAFHVGFVQRADRSVLIGFVGLHRPRLQAITQFVASLCNPGSYVYLAAIPVGVALIRRRPRLAVAIAAILLAANETTELLKPLVSSPRPFLLSGSVNTGSWPSGHATAAMSLALCAVIVVPARLRPLVGATMAAFAAAVCYSVIELGSHYPTDVLGGFLVATIWALLGMATFWTLEPRRRVRASTSGVAAARTSVAAALAPAVIVLTGTLLFVAVIAVARPHALQYAAEHGTFAVGAAAIGTVALMIATGATVALDRLR